MTKTFNIADLHGRSDLARLAVETIESYGATEDDTIVFTGDYIDRGPDSKGVIDFVMDLQKNRKNVVALKGNHETFFLETRIEHLVFWVSHNGGQETYDSYNILLFAPFPEEHTKWVRDLPLYYDDGKRLYVHAGVDERRSLEDQGDNLLWMLYGQDRIGDPGNGLVDSPPYIIDGTPRHVVHGHHQFRSGPKLFTNRSNFDTLAWLTGRLVIGVFDNDVEGGPITTLEVIGEEL